jgi:hypothetical protein
MPLWMRRRNEIELCARLLGVAAEGLNANPGLIALVLVTKLVLVLLVLPMFGLIFASYTNGNIVPNGGVPYVTFCSRPDVCNEAYLAKPRVVFTMTSNPVVSLCYWAIRTGLNCKAAPVNVVLQGAILNHGKCAYRDLLRGGGAQGTHDWRCGHSR